MTAWGDLQAFQDLPRLAGLAVSPDGARLVTAVATPDPARTRFRTALWEVDPAGADSPVPRVSLRAGRTPAGSISHSAVRKRVRFGSGVATVVTSRAPSGDTARPANRGRSWKACRSPHAITE